MEKGKFDNTKALEQLIRRERAKIRMQMRKPPLFERLIKIVLFVFSFVILIYFLNSQNENKKNTSIKMEELELVPKNKNKIEEYLKEQKENLVAGEKEIEELRRERELYRKMLEADKLTVEAIFKAQEKRMEINLWTERGIGFTIGIIGSIIASFLYEFIIRKYSFNEPQK